MNVKNWMSEIDKHAASTTHRLLVGNKVDLASKKAVTTEEGQALAEEFGIPFIETSAKHSTNVVEAFRTMASQIMENLNDRSKPAAGNAGIQIYGNNSSARSEGGGCC